MAFLSLQKENNNGIDLHWLLTLISYIVPCIFILIPFASFLIYGFFSLDGLQINYAPTLGNYKRIVDDEFYIPVLLQTCLLCLEVSLFTVLIGYPIAYFLTLMQERKKYLFLMLLLIPLLMSYVIKIYAIRSILGGHGFINELLLSLGVIKEPLSFFIYNLNAVRIALGILLLPFAILPIFLALEKLPKNLIDASADLGASELQTLLYVIFPLSIPGVATAVTFVFVLAIGDFLTPQMVGGINGFTFGRIIYSQFGTAFNWPFGAALSVILCVVVITSMILGMYFGRKGKTV